MTGIAHSLGINGESAGGWILLLLVLECATLAFALTCWRRMNALKLRWDGLLQGSEGQGVLSMLESQLDTVRDHHSRLENAEDRGNHLADRLAGSIRRVGMVKYDAFEDIGGEQSFALALLDDSSNGAVITGIVGRAENRVFAKELKAGQARVTLTKEEQAAIRAAERCQ